MRLYFESSTDKLDLDGVAQAGYGFQAIAGATGLGLPPKSVQWSSGAGDGSTSRGRRTLARTIDLPLYVEGRSRTELRSLMSRLNTMLATTFTLVAVDDNGDEWLARVDHVGGGDYSYGLDTTGGLSIQTAVTVQAGDPYFVARNPVVQGIRQMSGRGLLPDLANLRLTGDLAIGTVTLDNHGDQSAHVIWTVHGPGTTFSATSPTGELLKWDSTLAAGETLTIDTKYATIVDQTGANRYAELAPAPRFWQVPSGISTCQIEMDLVDENSFITAAWYPRTWSVI